MELRSSLSIVLQTEKKKKKKIITRLIGAEFIQLNYHNYYLLICTSSEKNFLKENTFKLTIPISKTPKCNTCCLVELDKIRLKINRIENKIVKTDTG